jgi:type VI secretion system secreted protein Hcp
MRSLRNLLLVLGVAAGCVLQGGVSSPVVMQLELTTVPGDSVDAKHPNTIDVSSFSFGLQMISSASIGGGSGSGKVNFNNLVVSKYVDKTSPTLSLNCASGIHLSKATLYLRPANATNDTYKLLLQDVLVTSISTSAVAAGERPMESVSFSFTKIQWFYQALDANGAPSGGSVVSGWDVTANKRL